MNILIVEDDKNSADFLKKVLTSEKYGVEVAYTYKEANEKIDTNIYSLILLDWNLPDGSGYKLLKYLREFDEKTPVIMITCESDIDAKADVLDLGADDYLVKPYSTIELMARIRAIHRRTTTAKSSKLKIGRLELDDTKHEIKLDEKVLNLTTTEYNLLKFFMQNKNIVLTRYQLCEYILKDFSSIGNSNVIDAHIKNLRKKLKDYDIIKTIRGVGYSLKTDI